MRRRLAPLVLLAAACAASIAEDRRTWLDYETRFTTWSTSQAGECERLEAVDPGRALEVCARLAAAVERWIPVSTAAVVALSANAEDPVALARAIAAARPVLCDLDLLPAAVCPEAITP